MTASLFVPPRSVAINANSRVLSGAKRYFYLAGTSSPATVYTDASKSATRTQPVVATSAGEFPACYVDVPVKVSEYTSGDSLRWTEDNIPPTGAAPQSVGEALYPPVTGESGVTDYRYPVGNVLRYGADASGVASSTTAFANAFTFGGEVVIPPGTYTLASQVAATVGNLTITAHGATVNCSFADDGTYKSAIKLTGTSASRIIVRGLRLAFTGAASGESLYGITIPTKVEHVTFDGVTVSGFRYYAASINATQQSHVGCRYVNNIHAGLSPYGGTIDLIGVEASNNGNGTDNSTGYGVVLSGTDCRVMGGRYADNDRYGIDGRRCDNLTVEGAYVYNAGYVGIYAVNEDAEKDCRNLKVLNCTVDMNNRASSLYGIWLGAYLDQGTTSVGEVLVHGNTVKNCLDIGILIASGDGAFTVTDVVVSENLLSELDQEAIVVGGVSTITNAVVRGNLLRNTGEISVSSVTNAAVTGNVFDFSGTKARVIYCEATAGLVTGNIANGTLSGGDGIELSCTSVIQDGNKIGTYFRGAATYDPGSLVDGAGETTTVTVTGAALGDFASAAFSLDTSGITITAWVSAANTVSVRFQNETGGTLDIGSGTLRAFVTKSV